MTGRALINSIKEGFRGIIRHPLVTIASITTIMLMLIIMGAFYMFSVNARRIMRKLAQRPPIEVYMTLQSTEDERNIVARKLADNPNLRRTTTASSQISDLLHPSWMISITTCICLIPSASDFRILL